jgi:hypothetical protein
MPPDDARLRASDAEREAVATSLRGHHAAGRLDIDELELRLERTYAARTRGDLAALQVDLPSPAPVSSPVLTPAPSPATLPAEPGLEIAQQTFATSLAATYDRVAQTMVPSLTASGYDLVRSDAPRLLVMERSQRPPWVIFACIFAFPFGLFALTFHETRRVVISLATDFGGTGTRVTVHGTRRRAARRALAALAAG